MIDINWHKKLAVHSTENKLRSWSAVIFSFTLILGFGLLTILSDFLILKFLFSFLLGLSLLRIFSLFHEFNHGAILRNSLIAKFLMSLVGMVLLSPISLWEYYHNLHHRENSKFSLKVMGDFATITVAEFSDLSVSKQKNYLLRRNFWVVLFGYITIFIISFCLNPFKDNPKKNYLGLICVLFHILLYCLNLYLFGALNTLLLLFIPMLIFGFLGGTIFYLQHNCEGLIFFEKENWNNVKAAIYSSSFIKMNYFWRFFTANVGFHNIHHLNSKIPFYNLPKAMRELENEVKDVTSVNFTFIDIIKSFRLKLYDVKDQKMIALPK